MIPSCHLSLLSSLLSLSVETTTPLQEKPVTTETPSTEMAVQAPAPKNSTGPAPETHRFVLPLVKMVINEELRHVMMEHQMRDVLRPVK